MMNTRLLMILSSFFMGLPGAILIFAPDEVLGFLDATLNEGLLIIVQITGALYFGFAILNWMARSVLIGGIYSRPLCIGNFAHFFIGAMALLKTSISINSASVYIYGFTVIYLLLAFSFGFLLFSHPIKEQH